MIAEFEIKAFARPGPVRFIRWVHPPCEDTRRSITAFLQRERARRLVTAAAAPRLLPVPRVKLSPGR
ncbi:hypothetical protein AB0G49_13975 [Streptomyces longwoodensis]|uniref:hypothetical protein n=1 Tax=Streptomyces longwoodensis TaxID=68231 RepID=UPI003401DDB6